MKIFYSSDDIFEANFAELLERGKMDIEGVTSIVSGLLKEIQTEGNFIFLEEKRLTLLLFL